MHLQLLNETFTICKVARLNAELLALPWLFLGKTDRELSLVCPTGCLDDLPAAVQARSDGWRALRVAGELDFALTGILAELASVLAGAGIPIFALSTYDTDYILVREDRLAAACAALRQAGHTPAAPGPGAIPDRHAEP